MLKRTLVYKNFTIDNISGRALDERLIRLWNDPEMSTLDVTRGMQEVEPRWVHRDTQRAVVRLRQHGVKLVRKVRPPGFRNQKDPSYARLRELAQSVYQGDDE